MLAAVFGGGFAFEMYEPRVDDGEVEASGL